MIDGGGYWSSNVYKGPGYSEIHNYCAASMDYVGSVGYYVPRYRGYPIRPVRSSH